MGYIGVDHRLKQNQYDSRTTLTNRRKTDLIKYKTNQRWRGVEKTKTNKQEKKKKYGGAHTWNHH